MADNHDLGRGNHALRGWGMLEAFKWLVPKMYFEMAEGDPPPGDPPPDPPPPDPTPWKGGLTADMRNSTLVQKFDDTPEGLAKQIESHIELERTLGGDKVPIPKGPEDTEGWSRFKKALGVPDKAAAYGLADAEVPESMKALTFDKEGFSQVMLSHNCTPAQAKGIWETYINMSKDAYTKAQDNYKSNIQDMVSRLRGEMGDSYDGNVELGQMVINKFTPDQETNEFITASLCADPRGVKFLAKIGDQFAENKIGAFTMKRFSMSPEEAQNELVKIRKDPDSAYMNANDKSTPQEHDAAVAYVNRLELVVLKSKQSV